MNPYLARRRGDREEIPESGETPDPLTPEIRDPALGLAFPVGPDGF